jgi:hypothetical protein
MQLKTSIENNIASKETLTGYKKFSQHASWMRGKTPVTLQTLVAQVCVMTS